MNIDKATFPMNAGDPEPTVRFYSNEEIKRLADYANEEARQCEWKAIARELLVGLLASGKFTPNATKVTESTDFAVGHAIYLADRFLRDFDGPLKQ